MDSALRLHFDNHINEITNKFNQQKSFAFYSSVPGSQSNTIFLAYMLGNIFEVTDIIHVRLLCETDLCDSSLLNRISDLRCCSICLQLFGNQRRFDSELDKMKSQHEESMQKLEDKM